MNSKKSWYLVYTKTRNEDLAEENLKRQGYETYLPRIQERRRRNGRYYKVSEAYFPRYLFIQLDTETDNWAPIRSTIGVVSMIRFGGIPAVVPEELVESLKQKETDNGYQPVEYQEPKQGDMVSILEGPFAGYQGIYKKQQSTDRVTVLLDIVGKNTELSLNSNNLKVGGNQ